MGHLRCREKKHNSKSLDRNSDNLFEGLFGSQSIENINLFLCRYILKVNKKTCKLPLYGELGRYPLYIDIIMSILKFWIRLHNNEPKDALLKETLPENLVIVSLNQQCWLPCIKIILDGCSLSYLYDNPQSIKDKTLSIMKKNQLKSKFSQNWSQQLDKSDKNENISII